MPAFDRREGRGGGGGGGGGGGNQVTAEKKGFGTLQLKEAGWASTLMLLGYWRRVSDHGLSHLAGVL